MDFAGEINSNLSAACRRCIELLRWRTRADAPHQPYASLGTQWSSDGIEWHQLATRGYITGRVMSGLALTADTAMKVQALLDENVVEPIAHKLLREARDGGATNPRSAIVISIAAVETGFKQLVADLVPDATWLVETVPSPPVMKMLKDYLPLLPVRAKIDGQTHPPPKYVRTLLTRAVEERNLVSHLGSGELDPKTLQKTLDAIEDTLYLLDYYAGQMWALDETSDQFREALGT
jgi:hypothetical protein